MWMGGQVAEKMSPVSAADVGTVAVITVSGLIGPERLVGLDLCCMAASPEADIRLVPQRSPGHDGHSTLGGPVDA